MLNIGPRRRTSDVVQLLAAGLQSGAVALSVESARPMTDLERAAWALVSRRSFSLVDSLLYGTKELARVTLLVVAWRVAEGVIVDQRPEWSGGLVSISPWADVAILVAVGISIIRIGMISHKRFLEENDIIGFASRIVSGHEAKRMPDTAHAAPSARQSHATLDE